MSLLLEGPDGYAISACDILSDFLAEHWDDPDEGPPEDWPDWTDDDHWGITDEADLAELCQLDTTAWRRWLAGPAAEPLD